MTEVKIPDTDNVVRYVSASKIDDGIVIDPTFRRPSTESDVSVNWIDSFVGLSKTEQLAEVRRLVRLTIRSSGRFAELNVGDAKQYVGPRCPTLDFISTPRDATVRYEADPSHGDIIGLPPHASPQARLVGDMIAECILALHPAIL